MLKSLSLIPAIFMSLALSTAANAQDVAAGEKVFKKCVACHKVGEGAENGVGPLLTGVVGRAAGAVEGYKYGGDLVAAGTKGLIWDAQSLSEFIADPKGFLQTYLGDPKANAKMAFRLKDETNRSDVIAFLAASGAPKAEGDTAATATATETPTEPAMSIEDVIAAQVFTEEFMSDPVNIAAGKEIWFGQCTHCHGYKAYPGKAPKLKPGKYTPEFVFKVAYAGFKKMPAWNEVFTVDEIRQVTSYVKASSFSP